MSFRISISRRLALDAEPAALISHWVLSLHPPVFYTRKQGELDEPNTSQPPFPLHPCTPVLPRGLRSSSKQKVRASTLRAPQVHSPRTARMGSSAPRRPSAPRFPPRPPGAAPPLCEPGPSDSPLALPLSLRLLLDALQSLLLSSLLVTKILGGTTVAAAGNTTHY